MNEKTIEEKLQDIPADLVGWWTVVEARCRKELLVYEKTLEYKRSVQEEGLQLRNAYKDVYA